MPKCGMLDENASESMALNKSLGTTGEWLALGETDVRL